MTEVLVPAARLVRWVDNFVHRHGETTLSVVDGGLTGRAADGSTFAARLPFDAVYDGAAGAAALAAMVRAPDTWGMLLVRKGGFAVARLAGEKMVEHKIGQRHVQGRTKAGGQSQQRFARRRDNQARQAYEAAADHAATILGLDQLAPLDRRVGMSVVTGGDHAAVDEVLSDPRLRRLTVTGPWLAVPDPRRAVLDAAVADALAVRIDVANAD
jgi:Actinobacteria/chloroflexi VLRF1 release factor